MNRNDKYAFDPKFAVKLLETLPDGVFTLDKKGNITSWNPAMERITGYRSDEAIGQSCMILEFDNCFNKEWPRGFLECGICKHDRIDSKECLMRHKNGNDIPVMKNAQLVKGKKNEIVGVVESVTDLTELKNARKKLAQADRKLREFHRFDNIIGKSHEMNKVFSAIEAASTSDATILIQGESGTGKELVAGAIHHNSSRSSMPLITVTCSALSESLLESELFGHTRGSFTGATRDRKGRFEEADGGTVFLDEIGEISPFIQVKLLRVLQEKEIERVGESEKRKVNIRIVAATNKNLLELMRKGEFREDLYYRLKVFPIHVPSLRHRKEDIPLLCSQFVKTQNNKTGKKIKGLPADAMRMLMDYPWPGNVRELENAIEHAFVLCRKNGVINMFDLPVEIRRAEYNTTTLSKPIKNQPLHTLHSRKKLSKNALIELLHKCEWNKAEAARKAGLNRTTIWKYMKKWNIPLVKNHDIENQSLI
ncbi:MAG: sigma 54-interacting transcriptional regulator [Deltaproteobacteria bacterium]|nr:sigma 54-interacting transcriptional regulator [Deltaproteobacteria bacterium]